MRNKGFTLIELMIVVAIIAIIAAIAIPSLLRSRMAANQTAAAAACKAFAEAEEIYHRTDYNTDGVLEYAKHLRGDNSLLENVNGTGDLGLIDNNFGNAEGDTLVGWSGTGAAANAIPKAGYVFAVLYQQGSSATGGLRSYMDDGNFYGPGPASGGGGAARMTLGYAISAIPGAYDGTGRDTYMINNNGTIFQDDRGSAASVTQVQIFDPSPGTWVPTE